MFKEEITLKHLTIFHKIEEETLPTSLYKAFATLIPKSNKDPTTANNNNKRNYANL